MAGRDERGVRALVDAYGRTYAEEAGIGLEDTPQPLYRLLVPARLLSARIKASIAVASARARHGAGPRDPRRTAEADRQEHVDAFGRGGHRRHDERTATRLGAGAELLTERRGGDLRGLRKAADGDVDEPRRPPQEFPGVGPAGAGVFLREVRRVRPEAAPRLDAKALRGARRPKPPQDPDRLLCLAGRTGPAVLAAAPVRAAIDGHVAENPPHRADSP
ncbi:endonuclease [Streptomyces sp. NPDC020731]|uniref:endonuclease n=1 Tax=Streptomyces sp. NPDC020731 TaxID=3365085 RepID=UPI0037B567CD